MNFYQAIQRVKELAVSIEGKSLEEKKSLLAKCAATTLSSKLIGGEKEFFASMVVDAVLAIGNDDRLNLIGIKKVIVAIFTSKMLLLISFWLQNILRIGY
jgi:T-complex protein 1 subunit eta